MEHINVVITSPNPNEADIDFVDYYFHHKVKRVYKSELISHSSIIDNTHPKVFIGGWGYVSNMGSGNNSGGSYPWTGAWDDVASRYIGDLEVGDVDEDVHGNGILIPHTSFSNDGDFYNRQGLERLRDPYYEDYITYKWLSWNATKIAVGVRTFGIMGSYLHTPYRSGGWRQLGPCGGWSQY